MTTNRTLGSITASAVLWLLMGGSAAAQYGGGMPGGGMGPAPPSSSQKKDEGPAEAAPEEEERPGDLEPQTALALEGRRRTQIIELNGYFRFRSDYMHQFDLNQNYAGSPNSIIHPPFPCPISDPPSGATSGIPTCSDHNLGSVNVRLRLEPTINISESVRVISQFDVLDNVLLGSTPNSLYNNGADPGARTDLAPTGALSTWQNPPEPGQSSFFSSVRAKRAWGEVDSEYGSLRFGRMPWRFGRGMVFNDGSCPDCNNGTTVDRVMAITQLYNHQFMFGWDFGAQGITTAQLNVGPATVQPNQTLPLDLSQKDDVTQLTAAVTRVDDQRKIQERLDRGELVLNYGFQLVYRSQEQDVQPVGLNDPNNGGGGGGPWSTTTGSTSTTTYPRDRVFNPLLTVNTLIFIPDLWAKLYWKTLTIEAEVASVLGTMDRGGVLTVDPNAELKIQQLGWVLAGDVSLYNKTLFVGLETGGATGDRAEDPSQYLNYNYRFVPRYSYATNPSRARMTDFKFSPDYHVDEIFFRHILGTVTNAAYIKPQIAYWFDLATGRKLGISGAGIYSLALVPVATPGNSVNLGAEVDFSAMYRNSVDGFYAGLTWGVFWPFGALQRPADLPIWRDRQSDASAAQVLRAFMGIRF